MRNPPEALFLALPLGITSPNAGLVLWMLALLASLAGAALLLCAAKPHLFLPFGIVLLLWIITRKQYRILAGFCVALLLGDHLKTGHLWSLQNRPLWMA